MGRVKQSKATRQKSKAKQKRSSAEQREAKQSKAKQSKAKQSKAKQSKAKQSKAKQSKAKPSKAKQSKAKPSKAKQRKAKQSKAKTSKTKHNKPNKNHANRRSKQRVWWEAQGYIMINSNSDARPRQDRKNILFFKIAKGWFGLRQLTAAGFIKIRENSGKNRKSPPKITNYPKKNAEFYHDLFFKNMLRRDRKKNGEKKKKHCRKFTPNTKRHPSNND